jgi:hypothetical protein
MLLAFYQEMAEAKMLELCSELLGFWTLSIVRYSTSILSIIHYCQNPLESVGIVVLPSPRPGFSLATV